MADLKPHTARLMIEAMAKHLPPSGSRLTLWDIGGRTGTALRELRSDLDITPIDTPPEQWETPENSVDSIIALDYDRALDDVFLSAALRVMRPGGRLIMVDSTGDPDRETVRTLESNGHIRILVEPAVEGHPGVLMRGEKPHTTDSTFARIRVAASTDDDNLTLKTYDGAYVFLLVRQSPNKPVWALRDGEVLQWHAALADGQFIAFTSLPKAVSFMQPAVMQGIVNDISKVGKFSTATAQSWEVPVMLNPTLDDVKTMAVTFTEVDPATAEAPDE
ncbi:MAG: hypothetical protein AAF787_23295 [Chloroflexota bacterium]